MIICAYYYPKMGMPIKINIGQTVKEGTEWDLLHDKKLYVEGQQRENHPLFDGTNITDSEYVDKLVNWCSFYKINCLTICWYWDVGHILLKDELGEFTQKLWQGGISYSLMWVQRAPHTELPITPPSSNAPYHPEIEARIVATSKEDLVRMGGELSSEHFSRPNYLKLCGRPVFSIFEVPNLERDLGPEGVREALDGFRSAARLFGDFDLLLLGIVHHHSSIFPLRDYGFDLSTSYVYLPDWNIPNTQNYLEQAERRAAEWELIQKECGLPYLPSVSVGWDATFRGERLDRHPPQYPWSPIITNSTPDAFQRYLELAMSHLDEHILPERRLLFIASMNEWTEGHQLEPSVKDGYKYLEAVRRVCIKTPQKNKNKRLKVLISDLDGTLVPESLNGKTNYRSSLQKLREKVDVLVYVTGRPLEDVVCQVLDGTLPIPNAIAADVGSTWWSADETFSLEHPLAEAIDNFPASIIKQRLSSLEGLALQKIRADQRVSYFTDMLRFDKEAVEALVVDLPVELHWSRNYLDVIPAGVSKGSVAKSICEQLPSTSLVFVAGNSLNDLHLFEDYGGLECHRVIAAGADCDLRLKAVSYVNVYSATLDDASGVLNVIEGLLLHEE